MTRPLTTRRESSSEYGRRVDADAHLVTRARLGDTTAFDALVERHHSTVCHIATAIVRSQADAEDVVQQAWLRVYLHMSRFHGASSFRTWLISIVRNHAIDHLRLQRRRARACYVVTLDVDVGSTSPSAEAQMIHTDCVQRLRRTIAKLPRQLREPLELWHDERYSYEEIARIAGVPTGTIKSRIFEARRQVQSAFDQMHIVPTDN